MIIDQPLRDGIVRHGQDGCVGIGRKGALGKDDRSHTDDTVDAFKISIRECITNGLVDDDEVRCESDLVEVYSVVLGMHVCKANIMHIHSMPEM